MESLELSLIRNAMSKKSWQLKVKYFLLSIIFYPLLLIEENKNKSIKKGNVDAEASAAGDDVYPLF